MSRNKFGMIIFISIILSLNSSAAALDINGKIARLDMNTATARDVTRLFGEPSKYVWQRQTFTRRNLPDVYIMSYRDGFSVVIARNKISEFRHEGPDGYFYLGRIKYDSSLKDVLEVLGQPMQTVTGEPLPRSPADGVLYKDIGGRKGYCYYKLSNKCVRIFFGHYKVTALYTTCNVTQEASGPAVRGSVGSRKVVIEPPLEKFSDIRGKNVSDLNFSGHKRLVSTLTFNEKTIWPGPKKMPRGLRPEKLLSDGMNPGLGIRLLHKRGITGKGVNVGIIDQPLYQNHPEFSGKIAAYHDVGCESESSMHGPAVASLLVGKNCGTAPGARVYYAAAPSWTKDAAYQAKALDWIIEQNESLPAGEKIRVVSVSAAPSGAGSPFDKNNEMWDESCARAEKAGILVLDCTSHRGFIGPGWYNSSDRDKVSKCKVGFPGNESRSLKERLSVPVSLRTTAEEKVKGDCGYIYWGRGGLSWGIPYCAGVLALGWQERPDLDAAQMKDYLFRTAHVTSRGAKIINPRRFILAIRKAGKDTSGIRRKKPLSIDSQ